MQQALQRLEQASNDMRRANESGQSGSDARRAAERLQEARDLAGGVRRQEASGQISDLTDRAARLAAEQKDFAERLRKQPAGEAIGGNANREEAARLASEKERMLGELQQLEKELQAAAREMAGTQRSAASKLRLALGDMQQNELALRMKTAAENIRRGYGALLASREAVVTAGLEKLRAQLQAAQGAVGQADAGQSGLERGLGRVEQLRGQWRSGGVDRAQGMRALGEIRNGFDNEHEAGRAVDDVLRAMERSPAQALAALEQLELLLRRKLEDKQSQAHSGLNDRIPTGYSEAVAEYFRRLSKTK